jgi:hypothetical protein
MINQQLVQQIVAVIGEQAAEYQQHQGMILTEDDLKCNLFGKIKAMLPDYRPTLNPHVSGSLLHSEVKFFDTNGKLTLIPDLTVIWPGNLSIFHSVEFAIDNNMAGFRDYSAKCFEIGGNAIIIELKFCRNQNGLTDKDIQFYQKDIDKIRKLQKIIKTRSHGADDLFGICAVFNKTNLGKTKFDILLSQNQSQKDVEILYHSGHVDFTDQRINDYGFYTQRDAIC